MLVLISCRPLGPGETLVAEERVRGVSACSNLGVLAALLCRGLFAASAMCEMGFGNLCLTTVRGLAATERGVVAPRGVVFGVPLGVLGCDVRPLTEIGGGFALLGGIDQRMDDSAAAARASRLHTTCRFSRSSPPAGSLKHAFLPCWKI